MNCRLRACGSVALGLLLCLGCGDGNPLNRQSVRGTVKVNGAALAEGTITFVPVQNKTVLTASQIQGGEYEIDKDRGLPPGQYAINISARDPAWKPRRGGEDSAPEWLPPEYSRDGQHKVDVREGANVFDFDIKAP